MDSLTAASGPRMYPVFQLNNNPNPNKLYAIPIFGFLIKLVMLIPVFFFAFILEIGVFITVMLINPFVVLFTGKYWQPAYDIGFGFIRYGAKVYLFMAGLTDKYPGFDLQIDDRYKIDMPMPALPNRLFAIPLLGIVARGVMMIPYFIWLEVLIYGSLIAVFFSFFPVLVMGKYPQVTYEFVRDAYRVNLAAAAYMFGLSDTYPSFWIDLKNNKTLKIVLIVAGALFFLINQFTSHQQRSNQYNNYNYGNYQNNGNYNLPTSTPGQNNSY